MSAVPLDKPLYAMFKTYSRRQENTIVEVLPGPDCTVPAAVSPGRAAGVRWLRSADAIGVVQLQARLPVSPRPHYRQHAWPWPGQERLHPRGPDPAAPTRPALAAHRVRRAPAE